jgi:hypothetical protein
MQRKKKRGDINKYKENIKGKHKTRTKKKGREK